MGDGLQAIQLEDGTTAYISQSAASLFSEGAPGIDANPLNLEQLQAQVQCIMYTATPKHNQKSKDLRPSET